MNSKRKILLIITGFFLLEIAILFYISVSSVSKLNDITHRTFDYKVTGSNPYIELAINKPVVLSDVRIVLKGYNHYFTECMVYWRGANEEDYTEEKSSWQFVECNGEPVSLHIDSSDVITELRIKMSLSEGQFIRSVYATKLSEVEEGICNTLLLFNPILCFLLIIILFKDSADCLDTILEKIIRHLSFRSFMIVLTFIIVVIYLKYLASDYYLIFRDIGSDSVAWHYPNYIDWVRRMGEYGWGDGWNPRIGLGMAQDAFFPSLENWFFLLGEDMLPYCFAINQCIKIWLAGVLAYLYVSKFTNNPYVRWAVSFGYSFCAHIVMYGAWELMGSTAVMVMLWLWLYESFREKGKYLSLCIGTVLFFITAHIYEVVLYVGFFSLYIIFRELSEGGISAKSLGKSVRTVFIFILIAIISSGDTIISKLLSSLTSERFGRTVEMGLFNNIHDLLVAFSRTVGTDIMGITTRFTMYTGNNFLEAPAFYCGIFTFLMVPVSVYCLKGSKRVMAIVGFIVVVAYMMITPLRFFLNGLSGLTWRLSSFWIIVLMVFTVSNGADLFFSLEKSKKRKMIIIDITAVLFLTLFVVIGIRREVAFASSLLVSMAFVMVYTFVLNAQNHSIIKPYSSGFIIILLVIVEIVSLSYGIVNNRMTLVCNFRDNHTFYYDNTVDALGSIKIEQMRDDFRVVKQYSEYMCDSLGQSYMGIPSYVGQTGIGTSVMNVIRQYRIPHDSSGRLIYGTDIDNYFLTLIGNRYIFSRNNTLTNYGYEKKDTISGINIYENQYSLPFAFCYDKVISEDMFKSINTSMRGKISLKACVVGEGLGENLPNYSLNRGSDEEIEEGVLSEIAFVNKDGVYSLDYSEGDMILIEVKYNNHGAEKMGYLTMVGTDDNRMVSKIEFAEGQDTAVYEIAAGGVKAIGFDSTLLECVTDIHFYSIDDEYFSDYRDAVNERKATAMDVLDYDDNHMRGSVNCKGDGVLFASIPYHEKWHIVIDGKEQEVSSVNCGFLGTEISAGVHDVRIYYETHPWFISNLFRLLAIVLCVGFAVFEWVYARRNGNSNEIR